MSARTAVMLGGVWELNLGGRARLGEQPARRRRYKIAELHYAGQPRRLSPRGPYEVVPRPRD